MQNFLNASYFDDAVLPRVSDSSDLSEILVNNFQSEAQFEAIFDDLKEGNIPDVEFNQRSIIFSETLPLNFLNHFSLYNGQFCYDAFFTPSQRFVMKYIRKTLLEMKNDQNYDQLLNYFANRLSSNKKFNKNLFPFCGEVIIGRSKKVGIYTFDDKVEIYDKNALFTIQQTVPYDNLQKQSDEWEQTRAEIENGLISPLVAVFRSFLSLRSFDVLPIEVYSGFINYFTSPDLTIVGQLLTQDVNDIEIPLLTVFMHKNLHRRLLKFCIYSDVFMTSDPSHLMRMNTKEVKIVIHFLTMQIEPLIEPAINDIKVRICRSIDLDFTLTDEETVQSVKLLTDIFIDGFIQILPVVPSSVRYVCSILNEACRLRFESSAFKGIFMAYFFRVIFPIICQPRPTDPDGLAVDVKKMAAFGKIMTSIFLADKASLGQFDALAAMHEEKVNLIYDRLTDCPEPFDVIEQPSFKAACVMIDMIRKKCEKKESELIFDYTKKSQILVHYLDLMTKYN